MKRITSLWCVVGAALGSSLAWPPEVVRDVVAIGGQTYIRTQRAVYDVMGGVGDAALAAREGRAAYLISAAFYAPGDWTEQALVGGFDRWNEPVYDFVQLTADGTSHYDVLRPAVGVAGARTWAIWYNGYGHTYAAVVDENGEPLGAPFLAIDGVYPRLADPPRLDMNAQRVVLETNDQVYDGSVTADQYIRFFTPDGVPLSGPIGVAVTSADEYSGDVALLPDGGAVVVYIKKLNSGIQYPFIHRVNPDFTLAPPVQISTAQRTYVLVDGLGDGSVMVFCNPTQSGEPAFARRFDGFGQALSDEMPIDSIRDGDGAAVAPDGRFATVRQFPDGEEVYALEVHLYAADGTSMGDAFRFQTMIGDSGPGLTNVNTPVAFDVDGTVSIAWSLTDPYAGESAHMLTTLTPFTPGDMNGDGEVNNQDIDGFILALLDPAAYQQQYPGIPYNIYGDFTGDGVLNNQDIDGFVAALFGG